MKSRVLELISLCMVLSASWPAASQAQNDLAQRSSQQLQYAEQVVRSKGYSPARLLALGQAQLAQGQLGPAIVSFERGLVLAPRDAALRDALTKARTRAGLAEPAEVSALSGLVQHVSLREWSYAASGCSVALGVTLLALTLAKRRRRLFAAFALTSALALAVTAGATHVARQRLSTAFALQAGTVLRQSPFATATELGKLRPGEALLPKHEHGDFVYVESERGQSGWVRRPELTQLAPTGASAT